MNSSIFIFSKYNKSAWTTWTAIAFILMGVNCEGDVTYHKDIAPVMNENCVSCHREGNIAPFRLDNYADVKRYAAASLISMENREMPPWTVVNSGECQTFTETAWLKDEDISMFADWIANEMPEGNQSEAPSAYQPPAELEDFTHVIQTPPYTPHSYYHPEETAKPSAGKHDGETHSDLPADDYRCFIVDLETDIDMYLTGFEVKSGVPAMAHHMILYLLSGDAVDQAQALVPEGEVGYECFGGPGVDFISEDGDLSAGAGVRAIAGWAPGTPPTRYPAGTGVLIPTGAVPVIQMHYNTETTIEEDITDVRLILEQGVSKEAVLLPMADFGMALEPGQTNAITAYDIELGEIFLGSTGANSVPGGVELFGVYPHMHKRGLTLKFEETTPGREQCLTQVDTWDFDWQRFYFYEEPIEASITRDSTFRLTCSYDTSQDTETVYWGDGTDDEMCLNFLYLHIPICYTGLFDCGL